MAVLLREQTSKLILFHKLLNFSISDSMNDFILTVFFGFNLEKFIDSEIPSP